MPSVINELLLKEVRAIVDESSALLLVDAVGLKAGESLKLRQDLFKVGAALKVCKANIVKKAIPDEAGAAVASSGSLGVVSGEDIGAAAKIVRDLAVADRLSVKGAVMEGAPLDAQQALALADLPSKDQLRGMLVNVLAAPLIGLARVINEVPTGLARAINAIKEQKEGA